MHFNFERNTQVVTMYAGRTKCRKAHEEKQLKKKNQKTTTTKTHAEYHTQHTENGLFGSKPALKLGKNSQ